MDNAHRTRMHTRTRTFAHARTYTYTETAYVIATDEATGIESTREVFVDRVARMIIGTSTRKIYVGDIESLDIHAFDESDNIFTSVEGTCGWVSVHVYLCMFCCRMFFLLVLCLFYEARCLFYCVKFVTCYLFCFV